MSDLQTALLSLGIVPQQRNSSTPSMDYFNKRYGVRQHDDISFCMRNVVSTNGAGKLRYCMARN